MPLPHRPLGTTGLMASAIGLGTVKLGRREGLKYPEPFDLPSDQDALALLRKAHDLGINLVDTAPAYGSSEERLGRLLPNVAPRDRWVLCTKAGESFTDGVSSYDFTPEAVTASVERSLRRLRTDVLDIVLLHSDGDDEHVIIHSGALDALRALKDRGLIRAVGASTKTPRGALVAVERCDVAMLTLNAEQQDDAPAAARALETGAAVLVKKALRSGHAGDPSAALRRVISTPGVSCVVVGTLNPAHLEANTIAARAT